MILCFFPCQKSCNTVSANDLNPDLDIIHQWKMEFNPDPTKQATEVLFSCKKSSPNHLELIFKGTVIEKVNEHKHLVLLLDSNLSFEKHLYEKGMLGYSNTFRNFYLYRNLIKCRALIHSSRLFIIYHLIQINHH